MKVSLSDRELLGVWDFMRGPIWGNSEDTLLAQAELWSAFGFDTRFSAQEQAQQVDLAKLPDEPQEFEISKAAAALLRSYLSRPAQSLRMGLTSANALKRLPAC